MSILILRNPLSTLYKAQYIQTYSVDDLTPVSPISSSSSLATGAHLPGGFDWDLHLDLNWDLGALLLRDLLADLLGNLNLTLLWHLFALLAGDLSALLVRHLHGNLTTVLLGNIGA